MKKTIKKVFVSTAAVAMIVSTMATGAFANTTDGVSTIDGTDNVEFKKVSDRVDLNFTLDGTLQKEVTTLSKLTIADARGTAAGWSVKLSADKLSGGEKNKTLDKSKLTLKADPVVNPHTGSSSAGFTKNNGDLTNIGGVTIVSAAAGSGMGTFDIEFGENTLELEVSPDETYKGTYSTTLTWTIQNVPADNQTEEPSQD